MRKKNLLAVPIVLVCVLAAQASVIVSSGNNPGSNEQNVLLNGISGPGPLITGTTDQSNTLVNFTSSSKIVANPDGQSVITGTGGTGVNGGTFSNVTIALGNGGTFTDLIFALDLPGTGETSACTACVSYSVTGTANGSGTLPGTIGPGTTFFTVVASGGAMTSVTLSGIGSQQVEDLRQVRLSGLAPGLVSVSATPEPESILLLLSGLGVFGLLAIFRRRALQAR